MTELDLLAATVAITDAKERAAFINRKCAGNPALRARLEQLLSAHEQSTQAIGEPDSNPDQTVDSATGKALGHAADAFATAAEDAASSTNTGNFHSDAAADDDSADSEALAFLAKSKRPDSLGRLGHYEILQVLGRGAFGIVFRAFDENLQRVVAVKMMAPQLAATSPARKRFLREARTSAQVRHENVVQVYAVEEQPLPYLVMEFIPGETLKDRLDRTGPLDIPEILRLGRQIAEGLAAAHANDLIHRDIKPGNVLIEGGQQRVKITDFGLARAADDASISQSGVIAGTPMYMAPEQALGQTLDQRADLFSLGSVLYQMTCGRPPFRANGTVAVLKRVVDDTPRPLREIIPEAPQWWCDIISKLHAKNVADRFQSAREVADVLANCADQLKSDKKVKDFPRIALRERSGAKRRPKWVVPAVAASVALAFPLFVLAVTEVAGITHVIRGQRQGADSNRPAPELPAPHMFSPEAIAESRYQKVLAEKGPTHIDTLLAKRDLAEEFLDQQHFDKALPMLFDVLEGMADRPKDDAIRRYTVALLIQCPNVTEHPKFNMLLRDVVDELSHRFPKDSPEFAGTLTMFAAGLLEQKNWSEAEKLLRDALAIREKKQPDAWNTFNTQSMLGGALLGQKKYTDAEPLLLKGYEGMKAREKTMPPQANTRIPEALNRLIELYTATNKPDDAKKWQTERESRKKGAG